MRLMIALAVASLLVGTALAIGPVRGFCNRNDVLSGIDTSQSCVISAGVGDRAPDDSCSALGAPYTTCHTAQRDAYVPGMQFTTLEDFYGDTGNQFRGSL